MSTVKVIDKSAEGGPVVVPMSHINAEHAVAADPERYEFAEVHRREQRSLNRSRMTVEQRVVALEAIVDAWVDEDLPEPEPEQPEPPPAPEPAPGPKEKGNG